MLVDEQADDHIMHLDRLGETDGLASQAFDAGPQGQIFAFNLLRI